MKLRNILFSVFCLCSFTTFAQTEKDSKVKSDNSVTEFKLKTDNAQELKNFDWNTVSEIFKQNDGTQEISLSFALVTKSKSDNAKSTTNNFEYKLTGKTADLDKMIVMLRKGVADRMNKSVN